MASKIKNIIIFLVIAIVIVGAYFFLFNKPKEEANLVSSSGAPALPSNTNGANVVEDEFLALLLSIKNIELNDDVLFSAAFLSLRNSGIEDLMPDGTEGRVNPFAPIGSDPVSAPSPMPTFEINPTVTPNPDPVIDPLLGPGVVSPPVTN